MRRLLIHCAALALLISAVSVEPVWAAEQPLEVVESRVDGFPRIVVRLRVAPSSASAPDNLTPDQIRVVEAGRAQPSVDLFQLRGSATAASMLLAIDVSGSMADQERLTQAREAAKVFLNQARRGDRAALLSFADQVELRQPFTSDRRLLNQAIDGLVAAGDTRLYDALSYSVTVASGAPTGVRAVVLLTDGEDTRSAAGVEAGIALANQAGIPVYTIGLGAETNSEVLERIAAETGGRFYHAPGAADLATAFQLISRQLASQYELYWISKTQGPGGQEVPVEITVNHPSLAGSTVRFSYRLPGYSRADLPPLEAGGALFPLPPPPAPDERLAAMATVVAALSALLIYFGFVAPRLNRRVQARVATYLGGYGPAGAAFQQSGIGLSSRRVDVGVLTNASSRVAARLLPRRQLGRLRRMMLQAGLPAERHLRIFLAAELALGILAGVTGYLFLRSRELDPRLVVMAPILVATLALLGFYLPYFWLRRRIERRRKVLLRALPDALDLMAIGVSAGLSLDASMLEVAQKWENDLTRELNQVLTEIRMGSSRRQALLGLVERTQLEDIRLLAAALIQAEELGTNISDTLTIQAEQLRIRRRQYAEELARKAPVKMLLPLVFLIFPALFVVILGPAMLAIVRMFRNLAYG